MSLAAVMEVLSCSSNASSRRYLGLYMHMFHLEKLKNFPVIDHSHYGDLGE